MLCLLINRFILLYQAYLQKKFWVEEKNEVIKIIKCFMKQHTFMNFPIWNTWNTNQYLKCGYYESYPYVADLLRVYIISFISNNFSCINKYFNVGLSSKH